MKKLTWIFIRLIVAATTIFALFGFPHPVLAFRGGYHAELTQECLVREGFGRNSIQMVQISNLNSDIYSDIPTSMAGIYIHDRSVRDSDPGSRTRWFSDIYVAAAQYLHFGYLTGYDEIQTEWNRLQANTYEAVYQAEQAHDVEGLLAALGISLHVVQDFYAHSNWSELDWGGDATWFDVPPERIQAEPELYTFYQGVPGHEHDAINKDYPPRRNFETAYREAYYASCEWVQLIESWVNPEFWEQAKTYANYNFAEDEKETRLLVWYSGTWKEPPIPGITWEGCFKAKWCEWDGSSEDVGFAAASWMNGDHVSDKWEGYALLIASPARSPNLPSFHYEYAPRQVWVTMDTERVRQTDDWWEPEDIDPGDDADFYAKFWATGVDPGTDQAIHRDSDRLYIETMYEGYDDLSPDWLTLIPFDPPDQESDYIGFEYGIWDDDGIGLSTRGEDDHCDINPQSGKRTKMMGFFPLSPNFNENAPITYETQGGGGDDDDAYARIAVTYTQPPRIAELPQIIFLDPDFVRPPINDNILGALQNMDLQPPDGYIDRMSCQEITGWAWDPKTPDQPVSVQVYEVRGTTEVLLGSTLAESPRDDLVALLRDNGRHGFSIPASPTLQDGQEHQIKAYAVNSNPKFPNVILEPSSSSVPGSLVCVQSQPIPTDTDTPAVANPTEPAPTDRPVDAPTEKPAPTSSQAPSPTPGSPCAGAALPLAVGIALFLGRRRRFNK